MSHTPGPWEIVGATHVWHTGENGAAVAMMAEPDVETSSDFKPVDIRSERFDEACANARLIAAAPDLLDALNGMVGLIQLIERRQPDLKYNHRFIDALAAIAKAEAK